MSAADSSYYLGPISPATEWPATDLLDATLVLGLDDHPMLRAFNAAGVLAPADIHVATRLGRLGGDQDESVALATALAVRAPRVGHVRVDLASARATAAAEISDEVDIGGLPWPESQEWIGRVGASSLVAVGEEDPSPLPLRLIGEALYLDRYWQDERAVASDLLLRAGRPAPVFDKGVLAEGLQRLFPGEISAAQRWAAAAAVTGQLTVIAGGPGTGKTTTVARLIALLLEQAEVLGSDPPLIGLAAPTGKAAARMEEAVRAEGESLAIAEVAKERMRGLRAMTLHRLLGSLPASSTRFRHDRTNRLPHDVVVIDETSMVALSLMARLLEAVRPDARVVLVGDPEQLASVEAGAVLADIVGPAADGARLGVAVAHLLAEVTASGPAGSDAPQPAVGSLAVPIGNNVLLLRANHRFRGALASLASAVQAGDADGVVGVLRSGEPSVTWIEHDASAAGPGTGLQALREAVVTAGQAAYEAAAAGRADDALLCLGRFKLLCGHRRGPSGVAAWNPVVEGWMTEAGGGFSPADSWYTGRPVILTANDYALRLFNGDAGIVVRADGESVKVAFQREGSLALVSPARLATADTAWVMTVHKAQGSEFDDVAVLLPDPESRVLTRELLYTALTRARRTVLLVGSEASVRAAVSRRVARASGLMERLWPPA